MKINPKYFTLAISLICSFCFITFKASGQNHIQYAPDKDCAPLLSPLIQNWKYGTREQVVLPERFQKSSQINSIKIKKMKKGSWIKLFDDPNCNPAKNDWVDIQIQKDISKAICVGNIISSKTGKVIKKEFHSKKRYLPNYRMIACVKYYIVK